MRLLTLFSFSTAALLLVAVSIGCERQPRPMTTDSQQSAAQVSLFNATHDVLPLRFQALRRNFVLDCDLITDNPTAYLREEHLTNPNRRFQFSGIELGLEGGQQNEYGPPTPNQCALSIIEVDDARLEPIAVSWPHNLPLKEFYSDVDAPPDMMPAPPTIIAEADYSQVNPADISPWQARPCGGSMAHCAEGDDEFELAMRIPPGTQYYWSVLGDEPQIETWSSNSLQEMPVDEDPDDEFCRTGRNQTRLQWDAAPSGRWKILSIDKRESGFDTDAPDSDEESEPPDCYDLSLQRLNIPHDWSFCGSTRLSRRLDPEQIRGSLYVEFFTEEQYGSPPAAYQNLTLDIRRESEEGELFELETIELVRGHGIPDHLGLQWEAQPLTECAPYRELPDCDQVILPSQLTLSTSMAELETLPGETVALDPAADRRFEFIRGMHRAVTDLNCRDDRLGPAQLTHSGTYLEFIYFASVAAIE